VVLALLTTTCIPDVESTNAIAGNSLALEKPFFLSAPEGILPPPPERKLGEVLSSGIVIVVSKASQQMHVFKRGNIWRSVKVSTGKAGKETPSGVFAILQKREEHYSNLYDDAPMPFMQRLTWDGIAIHAGAVPGYPASHGCVRVPRAFASELFEVTSYAGTAVIIADEPLPTQYEALALARRTDTVVPIHPSVLGYRY
jgi:hypothetical protein